METLVYEDLMSKMLTCRASFHEGSSLGVSPGVYEPRPHPMNGVGIPTSILKIEIAIIMPQQNQKATLVASFLNW